MRVIGLIGGMSWESSAEYYRIVNEAVKERLGGLHSARVAMYSVDFDEVEACQREDRWADAAGVLSDAAQRVERAGAACLLLCTNTMHRLADELQAAVGIPLLHIADATADAVREAGISKVGLLGTRYTMEQAFYRGRLEDRFGLQVVVPGEADREQVNRVIYEELCRGKVLDDSRRAYLSVIDRMKAEGAEGVILGCTEIPLLIRPDDVDLPVFDTTRIHALKAVSFSLAS
jgi:aspartate racemase